MAPKWEGLPDNWNDYWKTAHIDEETLEKERKEAERRRKEKLAKEIEERVAQAVKWTEKSNESLATNLELELSNANLRYRLDKLLEKSQLPLDAEIGEGVDAFMKRYAPGAITEAEAEYQEENNTAPMSPLSKEQVDNWEKYYFHRINTRRPQVEQRAKQEEFSISFLNIDTGTWYNKRFKYREITQKEYDILEGLFWTYHRTSQTEPDAKSNSLMAIYRFLVEHCLGMPVENFLRGEFNDLTNVCEAILYKIVHQAKKPDSKKNEG